MKRPLSFYARVVAIAAHLLLIVLMLIGSRGGSGALLVLPLLLPIAGIIRGRAYTYSWACMLVVFYAAGYLASGYAQPLQNGRRSFWRASRRSISWRWCCTCGCWPERGRSNFEELPHQPVIPREGGNPETAGAAREALDSRFRGNDKRVPLEELR